MEKIHQEDVYAEKPAKLNSQTKLPSPESQCRFSGIYLTKTCPGQNLYPLIVIFRHPDMTSKDAAVSPAVSPLGSQI